MKVSIITATYNSASTVAQTIQSVCHQTYNNIEHIIVDGLSIDNTLDIIREAGHDGIIQSEKDKGLYDAMNKGISLASGDIIGILNSDDFYPHSEVITNIVRLFRNKNCDAVYGDLLFVDNNHGKKVVRRWVSGGYNEKLFYRGWMPPHPTFFVRKELYEKFGGFNTNFKSSADYELMLRFLFLNKVKAIYLPVVLVHMRTGGQSTASVANRLAAHREDYQAWKINGLKPKWYTLILKPLRKVNLFVFLKRKIFNKQKATTGQPAPSFSSNFEMRKVKL